MIHSHDSLPHRGERVAAHSAESANRRVAERTEAAVAYFAAHPEEIAQRLEELEREWDIERTLQANAAGASLAGLALAITLDRRWLALPVGVAAFLLQHAVQGWCPPLPVFRRLGVRTAAEIARERYALKQLRGDFGEAPRQGTPRERARAALAAVRR